MKTALLVVDIQNDYFPGGKMELQGSPEAAQMAAKLLAFFRDQTLPRFFIQHIATRPNATFFLPGTPGCEIYPGLSPRPGEPVVQKHFPNSFRGTVLLESLQAEGVEQLVVCGMMTHLCIDTTVRAATDLGFACLTAADACATRDLRYAGETIPARLVHGAFLAALNGSFGKVLQVEQMLELLRQQLPAGEAVS